MSSEKLVLISVEEGIATITISRPKQRNSFTDALAAELCAAFDQANRDPNAICIVFTGNPAGGAFCAGADLGGNGAQFQVSAPTKIDNTKRPYSVATHRDSGGQVGLAILQCTKPVICAINGAAVGVGMTMACCCDIRVVGKESKVGFPFVRRGLACETLSSWVLPKLIGLGKAQELVLTGRVFPAKESPDGLFNYIVEDNAVMPKAMELAKEIRDNCSPLSLALSKTMLTRNGQMSPEEAHLIESKAIAVCISQPDNLEGIMSFLEKRKPKFTLNGWASLPDFFPWWNQVDVKAKL